LITRVGLHNFVCVGHLQISVLLPVKCVENEWLLCNNLSERFTHSDQTLPSNPHDQVRNEDILPKYVVSNHFRADNSRHNSACIQANLHIQILQIRILHAVSFFSHDLAELVRSLQHVVRFGESILLSSFFTRHFASVTNDDVDVAQSVHLVNAVLLAQVVKLADQARQQAQDIRRFVLVGLIVLIEAHQAAVKNCYVVKDVYNLRVVLYAD